jgi:hypothetical protein
MVHLVVCGASRATAHSSGFVAFERALTSSNSALTAEPTDESGSVN